MNKFVIPVLRLVRAFILIYACLYLGMALSWWLPVQIPGSVLGMILLFLLLALQIVPARWLQPGCQLLIRYMALLFVPVSVGVMQYFHLLGQQFAPIVVSCIVSTLMVLMVVGLTGEWLQRRQEKHKS